MQTEYHKWWSPSLGQEMELKVYGHAGKPVLVFPAQGGRFYEYEDFGMVSAVSPFIEAGQVRLYTVDSLDRQSWANWGAHPRDRVQRHVAYERYVLDEVLPLIRQQSGSDQTKVWTTGCSMGGYHAANFFFRSPGVFDGMISISGLFQLRLFVGDTLDYGVYFHSPIYYLPNLEDPWYLDQFWKSTIVVGVGQGAWEDLMVADALALRDILAARHIPAWVDLWGYDVNHDWPWWRRMMPYFLDRLLVPSGA